MSGVTEHRVDRYRLDKNSTTAALNSDALSIWGQWLHRLKTWRRACAAAHWARQAWVTGRIRSSASPNKHHRHVQPGELVRKQYWFRTPDRLMVFLMTFTIASLGPGISRLL